MAPTTATQTAQRAELKKRLSPKAALAFVQLQHAEHWGGVERILSKLTAEERAELDAQPTQQLPATEQSATEQLPSATDAPTKRIPNFVDIAAPLIERGFRCTPVHPETKMGVMKNWPKWQITSLGQLKEYSETGKRKKYAHHNVGIVSKGGWTTNGDGTEEWRIFILDIDAEGVVERIERETGHKMPKGYKVQSSPDKKPYKTHFYLGQTRYTFEKFGGWQSVNINRKDMDVIDEEGKHPTLYDLKGIGGGSLVVGAGSVRDDGQIYKCIDDGPVPDCPDWLVDWLCMDIEKYWDAVDADYEKKQAIIEALREKYTPKQRAEMRRQGLPDGFDIFFEDAYGYLFSKACDLSGNGISGEVLESALAQLLAKDVAGGREYASTDKGRSMLHKIAYDSNLKPGNASFFYRRREERPFRKSWDGDKKLVYGTVTRRMAIADIMRNWSESRLHRTEATSRIKAGLEGRFPFDDNVWQDIKRARKEVGVTLDGHYWVFQPVGVR